MKQNLKEDNFENSLKRLEEISNIIDNNEISLEESVKLYKEGLDLAFYCSEFLKEVEQEVEILRKNKEDKFELDKFDITKI